jgi:hypothetical protein
MNTIPAIQQARKATGDKGVGETPTGIDPQLASAIYQATHVVRIA